MRRKKGFGRSLEDERFMLEAAVSTFGCCPAGGVGDHWRKEHRAVRRVGCSRHREHGFFP